MRAVLVSVGYSRWTIRPPVYQLITLRIIFALSDVFLCCYYWLRNICIAIQSDELSYLHWLICIDHLYFTSKTQQKYRRAMCSGNFDSASCLWLLRYQITHKFSCQQIKHDVPRPLSGPMVTHMTLYGRSISKEGCKKRCIFPFYLEDFFWSSQKNLFSGWYLTKRY